MMETYAERLKKKVMGPTITTVREENDQNVENVIEQLRWRAEKGLAKYGITTERKDLSVIEWLQHLQEELMDATVYIEKLKSQIKEEY